MAAPALLSRFTAVARKAVAGVAAKLSSLPVDEGRAQASDRPVDEAEVPDQRAETGHPAREERDDAPSVSQSGHVTNQMSGTANKIVQAGDIHGGVKF